jgi:hypothetical protein
VLAPVNVTAQNAQPATHFPAKDVAPIMQRTADVPPAELNAPMSL